LVAAAVAAAALVDIGVQVVLGVQAVTTAPAVALLVPHPASTVAVAVVVVPTII
jgi:hypothetical protein